MTSLFGEVSGVALLALWTFRSLLPGSCFKDRFESYEPWKVNVLTFLVPHPCTGDPNITAHGSVWR